MIKIHEIDSQGVQLANGEREQTNQLASLKIINGEYIAIIEAFILNLPNIDLILGLPWYQSLKPVIDFINHSYFIQQDGKIYPIVAEENNDDPPSLCTNSMIGPIGKTPVASNFNKQIKQRFPNCFNKGIVVCD